MGNTSSSSSPNEDQNNFSTISTKTIANQITTTNSSPSSPSSYHHGQVERPYKNQILSSPHKSMEPYEFHSVSSVNAVNSPISNGPILSSNPSPRGKFDKHSFDPQKFEKVNAQLANSKPTTTTLAPPPIITISPDPFTSFSTNQNSSSKVRMPPSPTVLPSKVSDNIPSIPFSDSNSPQFPILTENDEILMNEILMNGH